VLLAGLFEMIIDFNVRYYNLHIDDLKTHVMNDQTYYFALYSSLPPFAGPASTPQKCVNLGFAR